MPSATDRIRRAFAIASTAAVTPWAPTSVYRSAISDRSSFTQSNGNRRIWPSDE